MSSNRDSYLFFSGLLPILEGISKLFYPQVEVVLHDLESGNIAAIYNNLSRRKVGERSAISKFIGSHADEFPDVFEPYYKLNWDGRKFKCVSVTIHNNASKPIGLMCINFDTSALQNINYQLNQLLALATVGALSPIEQYTEDWQQRVNDCITNYLKENQTTLQLVSKEQKKAAVNRLYNHGLFNYRKAASYICEQLNISRATVYNYLKEGEVKS